MSPTLTHRHAHGHNQLHCFADPTVSWDVVHHYKFEWFKNGDTRIESSHNLIEYQEKLSKPPGLVLTLGKIEVNIIVLWDILGHFGSLIFAETKKCAKFCQRKLWMSPSSIHFFSFLKVRIGIGLFVCLFIYNQIIDPKVFGSGSALFDKVLW